MRHAGQRPERARLHGRRGIRGGRRTDAAQERRLGRALGSEKPHTASAGAPASRSRSAAPARAQCLITEPGGGQLVRTTDSGNHGSSVSPSTEKIFAAAFASADAGGGGRRERRDGRLEQHGLDVGARRRKDLGPRVREPARDEFPARRGGGKQWDPRSNRRWRRQLVHGWRDHAGGHSRCLLPKSEHGLRTRHSGRRVQDRERRLELVEPRHRSVGEPARPCSPSTPTGSCSSGPRGFGSRPTAATPSRP